MRKLQIGVMGSAADLQYSDAVEALAEQVGALIAKNNATLIFGAEKDSDSLSTAACRGAKKEGGFTIGITYGKGKKIWDNSVADAVIATGLERGGGRETSLVLSCDAVIAISGGSGTLTELAIAYQANIPIVAVTGVGGWSDRLAGEYMDDRRRVSAIAVSTASEAVDAAISSAKDYVAAEMSD